MTKQEQIYQFSVDPLDRSILSMLYGTEDSAFGDPITADEIVQMFGHDLEIIEDVQEHFESWLAHPAHNVPGQPAPIAPIPTWNNLKAKRAEMQQELNRRTYRTDLDPVAAMVAKRNEIESRTTRPLNGGFTQEEYAEIAEAGKRASDVQYNTSIGYSKEESDAIEEAIENNKFDDSFDARLPDPEQDPEQDIEAAEDPAVLAMEIDGDPSAGVASVQWTVETKDFGPVDNFVDKVIEEIDRLKKARAEETAGKTAEEPAIPGFVESAHDLVHESEENLHPFIYGDKAFVSITPTAPIIGTEDLFLNDAPDDLGETDLASHYVVMDPVEEFDDELGVSAIDQAIHRLEAVGADSDAIFTIRKQMLEAGLARDPQEYKLTINIVESPKFEEFQYLPMIEFISADHGLVATLDMETIRDQENLMRLAEVLNDIIKVYNME